MMYNCFDSVLICGKSKTMLLFCRLLLQDTLNCGKTQCLPFWNLIIILFGNSKIGVDRAVGCIIILYLIANAECEL